MKDLTRLYSLTKTLRFKLIPQGDTLNNLIESGILDRDEELAKSYQIVKKILDDYHRQFIDIVLSGFKIPCKNRGVNNSFEEFSEIYKCSNKENDKAQKLLEIQQNLRLQIANEFKNKEGFKRIFEKEIIKEDLIEFVKSADEKDHISRFRDFTIYFQPYHENRKNLYTEKEIASSIAFRLIHQNLPKFIDNQTVYQQAKSKLNQSDLNEIYTQIKTLYPSLLISSLDEMFELDFFNQTLTQKGIDLYNLTLGMMSTAQGSKIKGLNEYINLFNQKQKNTTDRLPVLKPLFKQILSDSISHSWLPEKFETDNELLAAISTLFENLKDEILSLHPQSLDALLSNMGTYNTAHIYVKNDNAILTTISQSLWKDYSVIGKALDTFFTHNYPQKKSENSEKYGQRKTKWLKSTDYFSIDFLDKIIEEEKAIPPLHSLKDYFKIEDLREQIIKAYDEIKPLVTTPYPSERKLVKDTVAIAGIKRFLDLLKALQNNIKPLNSSLFDKDERFYGDYTRYWEVLNSTLNPLYDKVRNYITRKPYSDSKIKLNFDAPTLLDGWDQNKESDNRCILLRKNGLYYLAIMDKAGNKAFKQENLPSIGECYEKVDYKLLPGANKMLPKVFFSKSRRGFFNPSKELLEAYAKGTHKKGPNFKKEDCHGLIDFYKASILKHEDWSKFGFKFSDTSTYEDLAEFYREVERQGYKLSFRNVSCSYIENLVKEGKIYLFEIYNKDFSPYSKGLPNLFTLYWKALFEPENLKDIVYKLNGQAEIFFRKKSIPQNESVVHPANEPIENKNTLVHQEKPQSTFSYPIIKDKRYTVDQFLFHVPITMNFGCTGNIRINDQVNQLIRDNKFEHIIGIDRGERNLLYVVMIDMKGNIVMQKSLNIVSGEKVSTDYQELLNRKEFDRQKARQNWQTIEGIKQIKEGYLSQIIHLLSEMVINNNALIVLEDLNFGFKNSRKKFEKQVYEKFEKMLIDKFNYLILNKNEISKMPGGVLNAYQLTPKTNTLKEIGKQSGVIYYIPAWNTSKIDPVTGFVNFFDFRYENVQKAKDLISKFESIHYNKLKGWFEFSFDYSHFTPKAEGTRIHWTLCSFGSRIYTHRSEKENNNFIHETINLTEYLINLFKNHNINYQENLKEQILQQSNKEFFESLLKILRLTVQLRNSSPTEDYILSPVQDENGNFFDSRTAAPTLPQDADANGAYNIARKGLWLTEQIHTTEDFRKINPMTNKEWLKYIQSDSWKTIFHYLN